MTNVTLTIAGMHCSHCVMKVQTALSAVPGVQVRKVEVGKADLEVDETRAGAEALRQAIQDVGYDVAA